MEYRRIPNSEKQVSTIGLGSSYLYLMPDDEMVEALNYAFDRGINIIDLVAHTDSAFTPIGAAIRGRRDQIITQLHFGIHFPNSLYSKNRDIDIVKRETERDLKLLDTDYTDIGLVSNIDETHDFDKVMEPDGIWDYMNDLKRQGVIHHIGFSSHSAQMCNKFLDHGGIDVFMLSENVVEDFGAEDGKLIFKAERLALYQRCAREGVGITVMKAFNGGKLLDERTSPLGRAMTQYQCLKYALDRPGVLSCLPGASSFDEIKMLTAYYDAPDEKKDYSFIADLHIDNITADNCIYCGHCQPCTVGINIGLVNKYMDLANVGDEIARHHYMNLSIHASDCVECGMCDSNCPFNVNPSGRIKQVAKYFGL